MLKQLLFFWALCPAFEISAIYGSGIPDRYVSMAVQGDLRGAEKLFTEDEHKTRFVMALNDQFQDRFVNKNAVKPDTGDQLVDAILSIYQEYWTLSLMGHFSRPESDEFLERSLSTYLAGINIGRGREDTTGIFTLLGEFLSDRGFRYLITPAPPLQDLFLWKTEKAQTYRVRLTDSTHTARIHFIGELFSRGWKDFASLGLAATTGWVENGHLYCIESAYDTGSEEFEVSFLKHESRHLADLKIYPDLHSIDLEYRAKLTELAFSANSTRGLLENFTFNAAPNPDAPHSYANFRITRDIFRGLHGHPFPVEGDPWTGVNPPEVNALARELLRNNTDSLGSAGH